MFAKSKIALTAALVLGSASGALAFNNIGEIDQPMAPALHRATSTNAFAAFASAPRRATTSVAVQNAWYDRSTRNVRDY